MIPDPDRSGGAHAAGTNPNHQRLARLVTRSLNVPTCAVSINNQGRQWTTTGTGLDPARLAHNPLLDAAVLEAGATLVLPDLRRQAAWRTLSSSPRLRFYAGTPISTRAGQQIGVLSVMDTRARPFTARDEQTLRDFADVISSDLRLRRALSDYQTAALLDPLTGLPNRAGFHQSLRQAAQNAAQNGTLLTVGLLDLNNFKIVNDTLGHATGDRLLRRCAARLQAVLPGGSLAARLGGDEFALILPGQTPAQAAAAVEQAFQQPFDLQGRAHHVRWSLGLSVHSDPNVTNDALLEQADAAMYHAKRSGQAFAVHDPSTTSAPLGASH